MGERLSTMEITYPRFIHSQIMTHRAFSRNSSSSRAIPTWKLLLKAIYYPTMPLSFGENQKGMSASKEILNKEEAEEAWLRARDQAVYAAYCMADRSSKTKKEKESWDQIETWLRMRDFNLDNLPYLCLHKQVVNRVLEPYLWNTLIISATEWINFFYLRMEEDAQPEIVRIAELMRGSYLLSSPLYKSEGQWHLPYIQEDELSLDIETICKVSAARSARVSYLTQSGVRDIGEDLRLYDDLVGHHPRHCSPLEHVACCIPNNLINRRFGNFTGWQQLRKTIPDENITVMP